MNYIHGHFAQTENDYEGYTLHGDSFIAVTLVLEENEEIPDMFFHNMSEVEESIFEFEIEDDLGIWNWSPSDQGWFYKSSRKDFSISGPQFQEQFNLAFQKEKDFQVFVKKH